ncbi:hypothetical protein BOQ63_000960 (plasmid) [Streptomyces viridifaciens]|nr:hypothetical protein BOQ63_000960 [Streptomyces viridifaciens]
MSPERIARIGQEMQTTCPGFDAVSFTAQVAADLPGLELKARITRTAEGLHQHLPVTGPAALDAVLRSLPATPEAAGAETEFGLYTYAPHSAYVAAHHLHPDRLVSEAGLTQLDDPHAHDLTLAVLDALRTGAPAYVVR